MGLFHKKKKLTDEEREAKYDAAEQRFAKNIKRFEDMKKVYLAQLLQCRAKKLPEEKTARAALAKCISMIHQTESALMRLQLTRADREFAVATKDFFDCVIMISQDVMDSSKGVNLKKVEEAMNRTQFEINKQEDNLDRMIEIGDTNDVSSMESGRYSQYDAEIDSMIQANEGKSSVGGVNNYDKQRY